MVPFGTSTMSGDDRFFTDALPFAHDDRDIRSISSLLGRVVFAILIGLVLGGIVFLFDRDPVWFIVGASFGFMIGALWGVWVWAAFPYRSTSDRKRI